MTAAAAATTPYRIRPARADEEAAIKALIRAEHLDPFNVHWQNFLVAEDAETGRLIGIGQVKPFPSGRELGSLVVVPDRRQSGVGGALIDALIAREKGPLVLFCRDFRGPYYARFGFHPVGLRELPGNFKLKYALALLFSSLLRLKLIAMWRDSTPIA
jgi:N-acetylglutamate synthase-like GNAT family acetyltransferase